jgi:hypothetical protein
MRKEVGWKWYYSIGIAVSYVFTLRFSNISIETPFCERPKSTQRTLFILFVYDNCPQRGINIGLRNNFYIIHFTETTDGKTWLSIINLFNSATNPATFGLSANIPHRYWRHRCRVAHGIQVSRIFSYTSDTMPLLSIITTSDITIW